MDGTNWIMNKIKTRNRQNNAVFVVCNKHGISNLYNMHKI